MSEDRVKMEDQKNQYTGKERGQRGRRRVRTITVTSIGQPSPPDGGWGYAVIVGEYSSRVRTIYQYRTTLTP